MWIFLPGGLLMPSEIPMPDTSKSEANPVLTHNGLYTLQVRGRVESHLTNFIRDYMEPLGLPYSEIEFTPHMDYNVRFYTTKAAFGVALSDAVADIDYMKFKPTAERMDENKVPYFKDGKEYHSVLNSIWATVCRLGSPGGIWSRFSDENPKGYVSKYKGFTGSTFMDGSGWDDDGSNWADDDAGWTPSRENRILDLLDELRDIPTDQWEDFLEPDEFELVKDRMPVRKAMRRQTKKVSRKASRHYRRSPQRN